MMVPSPPSARAEPSMPAAEDHGVPAQRPPSTGPPPIGSDLVLLEAVDALRSIAARVETGHAQISVAPERGVLLDVVVGDVRCLLQLHRPPELEALSPREGQIARMVADGRTNRAIASALDISLWTVSTHLRRIFAKLSVGSRAEMVAHLYGRPGPPPPAGSGRSAR